MEGPTDHSSTTCEQPLKNFTDINASAIISEPRNRKKSVAKKHHEKHVVETLSDSSAVARLPACFVQIEPLNNTVHEPLEVFRDWPYDMMPSLMVRGSGYTE